MNLSTALRNQMIAQYESVLGTNPVLELRSGPSPISCESTDIGTLLVSISIPMDWLSSPSTGTVSLQGVWNGYAISAGIIAHYRLKTSNGTCHEQGTVYQSGGTGDLEVDNINVAPNQIVQVTTWTRTQGGQ